MCLTLHLTLQKELVWSTYSKSQIPSNFHLLFCCWRQLSQKSLHEGPLPSHAMASAIHNFSPPNFTIPFLPSLATAPSSMATIFTISTIILSKDFMMMFSPPQELYITNKSPFMFPLLKILTLARFLVIITLLLNRTKYYNFFIFNTIPLLLCFGGYLYPYLDN